MPTVPSRARACTCAGSVDGVGSGAPSRGPGPHRSRPWRSGRIREPAFGRARSILPRVARAGPCERDFRPSPACPWPVHGADEPEGPAGPSRRQRTRTATARAGPHEPRQALVRVDRHALLTKPDNAGLVTSSRATLPVLRAAAASPTRPPAGPVTARAHRTRPSAGGTLLHLAAVTAVTADIARPRGRRRAGTTEVTCDGIVCRPSISRPWPRRLARPTLQGCHRLRAVEEAGSCRSCLESSLARPRSSPQRHDPSSFYANAVPARESLIGRAAVGCGRPDGSQPRRRAAPAIPQLMTAAVRPTGSGGQRHLQEGGPWTASAP